MNDQTTPADQPTDQPEPAADEKGPSRWQRLRGRAGAVGKGTLVALLAGLLLGSAGGFAVGALTTGPDGPGDRDGWHGRPFDRDDHHGPEGVAPPGGVPGQLPPTTAPEESGSELNG